MPVQRPPITFINARLGSGRLSSLRIARGRIAGLGAPARTGDTVIDLRGDRVLPGLINAHDHLQLNALPRLKYRQAYTNVAQWIDDIRPRLHSAALFAANRAVPRAHRLLQGGMKNLLSGVTTVAHHDPLYPALLDREFPIRVLSEYGWSHSLPMDGTEAVRRSRRDTPRDRPWIIHAGEGIDAAAAAELAQLEALGCLAAGTVIVHGLALSWRQLRDLAAAGGGLVWCPSSNLHLFGQTLDVDRWPDRGCMALGSDSRLSGGRDLLAELRLARELSTLGESELESLVTARAARVLRLRDRGRLARGAVADILVLPGGLPLSRAERADIRLVVVDGTPRYADPDYAAAFAGDAAWAGVEVDGRAKCLPGNLVSRMADTGLCEPGLNLMRGSARAAAPLQTRKAMPSQARSEQPTRSGALP